MSRVITFYSYKGGVGRTFALANIAALLAERGKRVLLMDWDLEAPGLDRYFRPYLPDDFTKKEGLVHLLDKASKNESAVWRDYVVDIQIAGAGAVSLVPSGDHFLDYSERVRRFSWQSFFEDSQGGVILDRWRKEWKQEYDYVLLDSRTGITDVGGVCTVLLPDILVLVFSANDQSFEGGVRTALGVQQARRALDVERPPAAILPLPSRFDGRDEVDLASRWLDRFGQDLKPFYDDWLPSRFNARQMLELTKIPYVTRFSFGEPLAAITNGVSDPELPGFYLNNVARLLVSDFEEAARIIEPQGSAETQIIAQLRAELAQPTIDDARVRSLLEKVGAELGNGSTFRELANEAGLALMRKSQFDSAEAYFRRAVAFDGGQTDPNDSTVIESLTNLADLLLSTRRLAEAERLYFRCLKMITDSPDPAGPAAAIVYRKLGGIARDKRDLPAAEQWLRKSAEIEERQGNEAAAASDYNWLGDIAAQMREFSRAKEWFLKSLEIYERRGSDDRASFTYNSIGNVALDEGDLDQAEHWHSKSLEVSLKLKEEAGAAAALHQLGMVAEAKGDYAAAEARYKESLAIGERLGIDYGTASTYHQLGSLAIDQGDLSAAVEWYQRSLKIKEAQGNEEGAATTYYQLGRALEEQKNLAAAEDWYQKALGIFERRADAHHVAFCHARLGELAFATGKPLEGGPLILKSILEFQKTNDPPRAEVSKMDYLRLLRTASPSLQTELRRLWDEAGLDKPPSDLIERSEGTITADDSEIPEV